VTTDSNFNVHHLRSTFGSVADRDYRIYTGIDLTRFPWTEPTDRPPVIAAVGPFVESRGFEDLLEAVGRLVADGREIRLDLVGTGPLEAELRQRADHLGLAAHVDFLGTVSQRRLRRVLRNAAVFAAPCVVAADGSCGGLSTVLLEAMALGTACVTTPVGSLPEVVYDEVTGLVVPEREPDLLAAAIGRLVDDTELRFTLARAARHLVEQEFDVRLQTRQLRRLLHCGAASEHHGAGPEPRVPSGSLAPGGDPSV
jgi:glycosyltransferase involved in cell wall biosynthesis